ncbi:MAG: hypothetical protein ACYDC1_20730 [Limisphaerales bacterium]
MTTPSDFGLDLDLQLLPSWARQSTTDNRYSRFEGEGDSDRPGRRGDRFGQRDRPPRRDFGGGRPDRGPRGDRPPGDRRPGGRFAEARSEAPAPPIDLPRIEVTLVPEPHGVESLARQIKLTGRAYPLFDIARLVMQRAERFGTEFRVLKGPDGNPLQPLFVCSLDDSLWLSEDEVAEHVLRSHFSTFYQTDKVPADPPKGTYTLVAVCGMSGVLLGPPNLHEYQLKLQKLHTERFSRMPFEAFKNRVKMVRDEAMVKQWIEEQSFRMEFVALNVPEPLTFQTRDQVQAHFREVHFPNIIKSVDNFLIPAGAPRRAMSRALGQLVQQVTNDQRRFPIGVATVLSQQFASHSLQFFKVNKSVTHVCVARPHHLDLATTSVSDGVKRIVEFIDKTPGCTRKRLIQALAPTPPPAPIPILPAAAPAPTEIAAPAEAPAATETAPAATAEGAPAATTPAVAPISAEPTPAQKAVISDLHWLVHQGHVIEFTDGKMETAKAPKPKPAPTPPKPAAPKPAVPAATVAPVTPAAPVAAPAPVEPPAAPAPADAAPVEAAVPAPEAPAATQPAPVTEPEPTAEPVAEEPVKPAVEPGAKA